MGFSIFWHGITRWLYRTQRIQWVERTKRYPLYNEYMSAKSRASFWMQMSYRDRVILTEHLLGVAWGRFTDSHVIFFVELISANAQRELAIDNSTNN
jgi:hypothetical protein